MAPEVDDARPSPDRAPELVPHKRAVRDPRGDGAAARRGSIAPASRRRCRRSTARSQPLTTRFTELVDDDPDLRRTWHLVAVMTATVRGVLADGLVTDGRGFRALNDEDFLDWITRHGAPEEVAEFPFIRGLYDLVFAHLEDRTHHGCVRGHLGLPHDEDVLRVPRRHLLEDGGGHGRHPLRARLPGAAPARRDVRVLPSRRPPAPLAGSIAHRGRDDGTPGPPGTGRRDLRPAGSLRRPSVLSRDAGRRAARRACGHRGSNRSSRTSAHGRTRRRACCAVARTSTSWCSRCRSAWCPVVCDELIEDRPEWQALVDERAYDRDPGGTALAAGGRAGRWAGACRERRSARTSCRSTRGRRCRS